MATQKPVDDRPAVPRTDLPPAFDADHYLASNPDLAIAADDAADHYAATGRAEGRVASPLALRENLIGLIDDGRSVLEIGPFCNPLLRGANIAYLDMLDAAQLRTRAIEIGIDPAGCPDHIDYVGGIDQIRRRFDAVISSHAIEHQPDLIHHLQQIERILTAGGLFCLIVPDKRFCFDHYIAESTIADVVEAHREQRRRHSLASVIEHVALTTHNDSRRHWAGDHGPPVPPDRAQRVEKAIRDHDFNPVRYVDVHAWYFTPDSFRTLIETLSALGMIGLELAGVYDTARDRNEFCAVLRLSAAARKRVAEAKDEGGVLFLQTADADRYAPMLAITATNVREYCRRHGHGYESFLGVKRGFHPWQATFNRIPMLAELVARGFTGWAVYLDADAYIQDLDFDLTAYLAGKQDKAAIFATSGVTGAVGRVDPAVAFVNLGHPLGRDLVAQWARGFAGYDDDRLRDAVDRREIDDGQLLLERILERDAAIAGATMVEPISFLNDPEARFVRFYPQAMAPTRDARLEALSAAVGMTLGGRSKTAASEADQRWLARYAHPQSLQPLLVEGAAPSPRIALGRRICAAWKAVVPTVDAMMADDHQRDFAAALTRGDVEAVAAEIAVLGKAGISQGFFGGARQHERAGSRPFADRLARWTYDKLVSLAEAVGALPLENPEAGRWDVNAQIDPRRLFDDIQVALDADLSPPDHVGGHLGIAVGDMVLHMRMIDSIHAAWRLREFAEGLGLGHDVRIAEIGAGAGFTAFYARRLGLQRYRLFDRPVMAAIQGYVLGAEHPLSLDGEASQAMAVLHQGSFATVQPGSIDILFNTDTLPEIGEGAALRYLADARRVGIPHILSINQEAGLPGQTSVPDLIGKAGGYRRGARHRHWLRAGYVEEHYRLV